MHWKRKYDNYNCSAFYEPSYVIARAYQNGRFSFGGRDKMKKKIALVITIAVCIVSVSANVYQYRVIQNKNASITWNQKVVDQMFQKDWEISPGNPLWQKENPDSFFASFPDLFLQKTPS